MPRNRSVARRAIRAVAGPRPRGHRVARGARRPAQAPPDAPHGPDRERAARSRRCRGTGSPAPRRTACRARRTRRSSANLVFNQETTNDVATRPTRVLAAARSTGRCRPSTPPAASALVPQRPPPSPRCRPRATYACPPGRRSCRPVSPPVITLGARSPARPATTSRSTPRVTASAALVTDRHQDHDVRLARPAGRRRAQRHRGLLRPGARQVRQQPAERLDRLRPATTWPSCPAVTSATCATGLVCAPAPRRPASAPASTVQDVVFDWDPVKGAKQYEIWVALDQDFNTQVEKRTVFSHPLLARRTTLRQQHLLLEGPRDQRGRTSRRRGRPRPSVFERRWPVQAVAGLPAGRRPRPVTGRPLLPVDPGPARDPLRARGRHRRELHRRAPSTTRSAHRLHHLHARLSQRASQLHARPRAAVVYWRVRAARRARNPASQRRLLRHRPVRLRQRRDRCRSRRPTAAPSACRPSAGSPSHDANEYVDHGSRAPTATVTATTSAPVVDADRAARPADSDDVRPRPRPRPLPVAGHGDRRRRQARRSPTPWDRSTSREAPLTAGAAPLTPSRWRPGQITSRFPALAWQPLASEQDNRVYYKLQVSETPGIVLVARARRPILNKQLAYPAVTDLGTYFLSRPGTYTWCGRGLRLRHAASPRHRARLDLHDRRRPTPATGQQVALDGARPRRRATPARSAWSSSASPTSRPCAPACRPRRCSTGSRCPVPAATRSTSPRTPTSPTSSTTAIADHQLAVDPADGRHRPSTLPDNESGPAYYWYIRPCAQVLPTLQLRPGPVGASSTPATSAFRKVSPRVALRVAAPTTRRSATR